MINKQNQILKFIFVLSVVTVFLSIFSLLGTLIFVGLNLMFNLGFSQEFVFGLFLVILGIGAISFTSAVLLEDI